MHFSFRLVRRLITRWLPRLLAAFLLLATSAARADIILLLSDDKPSVTRVAQAIQAASAGNIVLHKQLNGDRNRESEIARAILESPASQVVAIGLGAAQLAREHLNGKQVVFCQVLNFEEFDLVTPWMKGVSAIPSLSRQFATWKLLDPTLRRIGIITGRHTQYMISEAAQAAKRLGLELVHEEASSERAVLFAAQKLHEKKIQGLWLAPDSSILSQRAMQDVMTYSIRNSIQVLAFSPALLKEGALLSTSPDPAEIARLVLERLQKVGDGTTIPGEAVTPLSMAKIAVNRVAAERFRLTISPKLLEQAHVQ